MAINLLTDAKIKTAKPKEKKYLLRDGRGLWLIVYPSGLKSWCVFFKKNGKKTSKILGEYPTFSLNKARERHLYLKKYDFNDKSGDEEIFSESFEKWYENWRKSEKPAPKSEQNVLNRAKHHLLPAFGNKALYEIKRKDVIAFLVEKSQNGRQNLSTVLLIDIKRIFRHAIIRDICEASPAEYLNASEIVGEYKRTNRPAIADKTDLSALIAAINSLSLPVERYALQLMMLFATRTNELLNAKWCEFDFEQSLWRIPAERMKNRVEHIVPLARQAVEILQKLKEEVNAGEWLFFTPENYKEGLLLKALYKLGYKGKMCGHGFRTTFMVLFLEIETQYRERFEPVLEKHLAHTEPNATKRAYDRSKYMQERIEVMQRWADYLDTLRG